MNNSNEADQFIEIREVSWITRIQESLKGTVAGIVIIFIAFFLLIGNEARHDVDQLANNQRTPEIVHISSDSAPSSQDIIGKPISMTGYVSTQEMLGDNLFLKPGSYIALTRQVEMYAWEESRDVKAKTNVGGSQTQQITATYTKKWLPARDIDVEWTSLLDNDLSVIRSTKSSAFLQPENHSNPPLEIENEGYRVSSAKVGIYDIDMNSFSLSDVGQESLPTPTPIQLTEEIVNIAPNINLSHSYLYKGTGSSSNPQVGDLRIQYNALPSGTDVTVMGKLTSENRIVPYPYRISSLFRIFPSSLENARVQIEQESIYHTWGYRLLGFLLMWFGLRLLVEPLNILLDILPIFGAISRIISGYATLLMASSLTLVTILVYRLTFNLLFLAIAIPITFISVIVFLIFSKRR